MTSLDETPLGQDTAYPERYDHEWLAPLERNMQRSELKMSGALPFSGYDYWNAYELSWLNSNGLPQVTWARFKVPCDTRCIVESKSLKLYLNSFNQEQFASREAVHSVLVEDLSKAFGRAIEVHFTEPGAKSSECLLTGVCIDEQDVSINCYEYTPSLLKAESTSQVEEELYSHLFRSNCPVTGQPDWANIWIKYNGLQISREALLRYLVSYRKAQGFHEHCVEQIFVDISKYYQPQELIVAGYFTRRGGLDINPIRASHSSTGNLKKLLQGLDAGGAVTYRQ